MKANIAIMELRLSQWAGSSAWPEHQTFNLGVLGSNPSRLTNPLAGSRSTQPYVRYGTVTGWTASSASSPSPS